MALRFVDADVGAASPSVFKATAVAPAAALAPASVAAPAAVPAVAGWYNPTGYDASNPLASLNKLTGLQFVAPRSWWQSTGDSGDGGGMVNDSAYVLSSNKTRLDAIANGDGTYTFSDTYNDPAGKSEKDQLGVTYRYDPATGVATPVSAGHNYVGSWWTQWGQTLAAIVAVVASAGAAGYAAAGEGAAGAAGGAGEGLSGMDLAADAAYGSGNNIVTAGEVFGPGAAVDAGVGAGSWTDTPSGMDLAADAAPGTGNHIGTAGQVFGASPVSTLAPSTPSSPANATPASSGSLGGSAGSLLDTVGKGAGVAGAISSLLGGTKPATATATPTRDTGIAAALSSNPLLLLAGVAALVLIGN